MDRDSERVKRILGLSTKLKMGPGLPLSLELGRKLAFRCSVVISCHQLVVVIN